MIETKYHHIYTGITLDWQRRFDEHNASKHKCAKALKGKGPLILKYCITLANRRTAMQAEIWLKKQSKLNKQKIIQQKLSIPFEHSSIDISLLDIRE